MNHYGRLAFDHASQFRPRSFASMTDPIGHFSRLGELIEAQITRLRDQLLGDQRSGESLEDYRRRSYQARRQAEEMVLAEQVWVEVETTTTPDDDEVLAYRSQLALSARALASADPSWADVPPQVPPQP